MPESRSKLIAAATPLFAEKGFHAVSVREIAKAADMNLSMISYYFDGKEGLYAAVLADQFATLYQVAEVAKVDADPLEKFRLYVLGAIDRHRKNPFLVRFYTSELTNPTPCFDAIVKPAIQGVVKALDTIFADGLATGLFRPGLDPVATAVTLAGMTNFQFLVEPATRELADPSAAGDEELARHVMDIFARGVVR